MKTSKDEIEIYVNGYAFIIKTNNITKDMVRSAKRWLSIKDYKYRNFCPFQLQQGGCLARCGNVIETCFISDYKKDCLSYRFNINTISELIEKIVMIYEGRYIPYTSQKLQTIDSIVLDIISEDDEDEIY